MRLKIPRQLAAMVATCVWLSGAIDAAPPADLVLTGGKILTMDPTTPTVESIACRGDRVVAIGSEKEIAEQIGPKTRVLKLKGLTVVPGFIEGHGHFIELGRTKQILDLTGAKRWEDIVIQVRDAAAQATPGAWIIGRGWHQSKWASRPHPHVDGYPVHTDLSRVSPRNPVRLVHASGHMSIANRIALQMSDITAATSDPSGGEILKDERGQPTGVLRENAQALLRDRRRTTSFSAHDELRRAIQSATEDCLKNGITTFHDAGSLFSEIDLFRELAESDRLGVRLYVMIRESNSRLRRSLANYRMVGVGNNHLTVRAIKQSIDGALGSHSAWLLEPYDDLPESSGLQTLSLASLQETVKLAHAHDFQLCVHAIGDRANREVLDLYQQTFADSTTTSPRRWRIEHAQHLHPREIPRFAKLDVIASVQGVHCTSDAPFVIQRLGERRARQGAYAWQSLLKSGAVVINGTDAPVENVSPIKSFYASVTRRTDQGHTFFPEQRMTRQQALESYTRTAAYAGFEEDLKGTLVPGKLADMVVLTQDLLRCAEDEILSTQVVHTIIGGKVVYSRDLHSGD